MKLTVSRKKDKNLAVRRKNERILTVSGKKMLTVKKSNHKIKSRDLLLSLVCYAFTTVSVNRKCRKCLHNGCRCTSWQTFDSSLFTTSYFLSCWLVTTAVFKAIVSLYRAGEEKLIELFSSFQKKILSSFLGSTSKLKSSAWGYHIIIWGHLTWNFTAWRKSMAKRRITLYQHSSTWSWNCPSCLAQMGKAS